MDHSVTIKGSISTFVLFLTGFEYYALMIDISWIVSLMTDGCAYFYCCDSVQCRTELLPLCLSFFKPPLLIDQLIINEVWPASSSVSLCVILLQSLVMWRFGWMNWGEAMLSSDWVTALIITRTQTWIRAVHLNQKWVSSNTAVSWGDFSIELYTSCGFKKKAKKRKRGEWDGMNEGEWERRGRVQEGQGEGKRA